MDDFKFFSGKNVLITGATGLLGSNMLKKLKNLGAKIRAVIHEKDPEKILEGVEYIRCDLTKKYDCDKAVKGIDYVFHCAAQSFGAKKMKEDPKSLVTPNIIMNSNLLDSSSEAGVKKFCFISSNAVYPVLDHPVKEEEADGNFFDLYVGVASVKYFTEKLCEFYSKKYPMQCIVVRPANYYGPGDKFGEGSHVIPALIERAIKKENPFVVWGTGENVKDFIYVEDAVDGIIHAFKKGHALVNIGSGKGYKIKEIVNTIMELTKFNGEAIYDSTKPDAIMYRVLDTAKSDFLPKTTLKEGLSKTIEWALSSGKILEKMSDKITKEDLINFEKWCVDTYKEGKLRSPLHLSGGNEEFLIALFENIKEDDWVFTTYRSHYHSLLKGVPKEWLKQWVLNNKSIHVMNKEHKIFTSAIVGGTLSPALGAALAIKLKGQKNRVWAFCGDMTAESGIFHEVTKYARRNNLPITFIVEDNGLSTDTPTQEVWGLEEGGPNIIRYQYKRIYPHYGVGVFVDFKDEKGEKRTEIGI